MGATSYGNHERVKCVGMLLGVWDNNVVSGDHLLSASPVGWASVARRLGGVGSGGVLCENCIVDASIFIFLCVTDRHPGGGGWLFFVRVLVHRPAMFVVGCCVFVVKGTWWMPWHAGPMKDV